MRRLLVIGIGAGDPDYLTIQAIKALNRVDVIFVIDKGREKAELVQLRAVICDRYIENATYRTVEIEDPPRDRRAAAYRPAVEEWRRERANRVEAAILEELGEDECGAFLVWGDPSLYDSTLAVVEEIVRRGNVAIDYDVIPGISSVQALAARHKVTLNRVGEAIQITTGRRLLTRGLPADAENVVVMLDAECSFKGVPSDDLVIYWGAYLGTDDEVLCAGPLAAVGDDIERARREARERHGWIMDTYLLRRRRE